MALSSFRARLALGFGALVLIAFVSGLLAVATLSATARRATDVSAVIIDELAEVQDVRVRAEQVVVAARGFLLTQDETFRRQLELEEADLETSLGTLRAEAHEPAIDIQLAVVEQLLRDYSRRTAAAARKHASTDLKGIELAFEQELVPRKRALDMAALTLVRMERAMLQREANRAAGVAQTFSRGIIVAWLGGLGVAVALALLVMRRLAAQYRRVEQAEQAAREAAAARKQILDIVAHDLLTPLNAIVLGLEVSKARGVEVPHGSAIANAADRMHRLVNDLVDASRAERRKLEISCSECDVASLLAATVELFAARAANAGVELRHEAPPGLRASLDADRIGQVLSNLIGNAITSTPRGGVVAISATLQPDGGVRFAVTDSGPGLPDEDVAGLFQAYKQGSSGRRGSLGLGLYICKSLVEAHGGQIGAESSPRGTTFWVRVPRESPT